MPTETTTTERILVIADETIDSDVLLETIEHSAVDGAEVLAVVPAPGSRLRLVPPGDDDTRRRAKERLQRCVERLDEAGIAATGWIADADPLLALRDALAFFPADTVIVSTNPAGSIRVAADLLDGATCYFDGPILHLTVGSSQFAAAV